MTGDEWAQWRLAWMWPEATCLDLSRPRDGETVRGLRRGHVQRDQQLTAAWLNAISKGRLTVVWVG